MKNTLLSAGLQQLSSFIRLTNLGNGSTWPGNIALMINPKFIQETLKEKDITSIFVAGTNGKTTTSRILKTILVEAEYSVFQNESGANLLNGIASSLILNSEHMDKRKTYAIFEVDENALPSFLQKVTPKYLVLLNLFRDQLDRYGEVRTIAAKWRDVLEKMSAKPEIIANGDDPEIVWVCEKQQSVRYFGLPGESEKKSEHAADSIYCPNCGHKLVYTSVTFSHLGDWKCPSCRRKHPNIISEKLSLPLSGSYNEYNALAAYLTAVSIGIERKDILEALKTVTPAFGRQEKFHYDNRTIELFLSKNPTSLNESLRTIRDLGGKYFLFLLNDRIPDGQDISWIWDVDFETLLPKNAHLYASGDRAYDMAVRLKYAHPIVRHVNTHEIIEKAFGDIVRSVPEGKTLYILPTYSAMLGVRQIVTGRKIL